MNDDIRKIKNYILESEILLESFYKLFFEKLIKDKYVAIGETLRKLTKKNYATNKSVKEEIRKVLNERKIENVDELIQKLKQVDKGLIVQELTISDIEALVTIIFSYFNLLEQKRSLIGELAGAPSFQKEPLELRIPIVEVGKNNLFPFLKLNFKYQLSKIEEYDYISNIFKRDFLENRIMSIVDRISLHDVGLTYDDITDKIIDKFNKDSSFLISEEIILDAQTDYLFFSDLVQIKFIETLEDYRREIEDIDQTIQSTNDEESVTKYLFQKTKELKGKDLYYRGHTNINYILEPSIYRGKFFKNEKILCEESQIRNPDEYEHCLTHLDRLKKMQHYSIPTRLLDISRNALMGLYFAVEKSASNEGVDGEVVVFHEPNPKYTRSDTVALICSLAFFDITFKQKIALLASSFIDRTIEDFNEDEAVQRLIHEVLSEKSAFSPKIIKEDLCNNYIVLPTKDNKRIIQQDGAFIACSLNMFENEDINQLRAGKGKKVVLAIKSSDKKSLRETLNLFGLNKATVYPEIDKVAEYLKEEYID